MPPPIAPFHGALEPKRALHTLASDRHHSASLFVFECETTTTTTTAPTTTIMSPLAPPLPRSGIPPTFQWPVKYCLYTTVATYVLSLLSGNVSQVDRVWTFLPVIYTAYYALLPFWPYKAPLPLFPTIPEDLDRSLQDAPNPRTLLMLVLQVRLIHEITYILGTHSGPDTHI